MIDRRPKLHQIDAFRAVLQVRSVTEAARLLRISQPAVSTALRQLEASLGCLLFERVAGRLLPTPDAAALMPAVEAVAQALDALAAAGRAVREGAVGQVSLVAIPSLATAVLPAAIHAAVRRHPGLRVTAQIAPTRQAVDAVVRGAVDLGLVHDIVDEPLVQVEDLGPAAMACAVPAGHRLAKRRGIHARDLRGVGLASYAVNSPIGERLRAVFEAEGEVFSPTFELGASTVICEVALAAGVPALVEGYIPESGRWPGLVIREFRPRIALQLRLLTTLQRPVPLAAKLLAGECRRVVAQRFVSGLPPPAALSDISAANPSLEGGAG